jgi:hypothetical protein
MSKIVHTMSYRDVAERTFPTEYQLTHNLYDNLYSEASNLDWDEISHRYYEKTIDQAP